MAASDAAELIHHEIRLPSGRRHHFVTVSSGGPRIVLLHGFTDSWRTFELLFAPLGAKFHLFALDQRGHGASEAADDYATGDFSAAASEDGSGAFCWAWAICWPTCCSTGPANWPAPGSASCGPVSSLSAASACGRS